MLKGNMKIARLVQAQDIEQAFSVENLVLDIERDFAVLIRQSKKGASTENGESRDTQLALVSVAENLIKKLQAHVRVRTFDEKDGVSGRKGAHERPELFSLLTLCKAGKIGTIFVTREDRLYRDEYGDEAGSFLRIAHEQRITVVVPLPGSTKRFKVYRLWKYEDRERFKEAMKSSAAYLNQIRDMNGKNRQKAARGCYDGRMLPPGLAILRPPEGLNREEKKVWKQHQKPVLYEPWAKVMRAVFQELQDCEWDISRVFRSIHARETPLFPDISAEDKQIYIIRHCLTPITKGGTKGFTVGFVETMRRWITNYHLLGWWLTWSEVDEDTGERIEGGWIPDNHPSMIDRAVLEEGHARIFGCTIEGEPIPYMQVKQSSRHTKSLWNPLLLGLLHYPEEGVSIIKDTSYRDIRNCKAKEYKGYLVHRKKKTGAESDAMFVLPAPDLETIIIKRIEEFCSVSQTHDMAQRVKNRLEQLRQKQVNDHTYIESQLQQLDKEITALRKRLVTVKEVFEISEEDIEKKERNRKAKMKRMRG